MKWERAAWAVGAAGIVASIIGWIVAPNDFAFAWLAAVTAWIGWPLGCIALVFIHVLTGGQWGLLIRPQLALGIGTLPLLLPAVLPIIPEAHTLYPWLRPEEAAHLTNTFYLNATFALVRGIAYLLVWFGCGALALRVLSGRPGKVVAPPALILLGLTASFAAIDATMSLDPHFISSDYGMVAAAQAGLLALSVCVFGASQDITIAEERLDGVGRLLLGLVILWAYLDFMQILIVWQSDLPDEAGWYIARSTHGWGTVAGLIARNRYLLFGKQDACPLQPPSLRERFLPEAADG